MCALIATSSKRDRKCTAALICMTRSVDDSGALISADDSGALISAGVSGALISKGDQ